MLDSRLLAATLLTWLASCASVGVKLSQSLVAGTAGVTPAPSEFADPPLAVEGDDITVATTSMMFDAALRVGRLAEFTFGYGMLFPSVRARSADSPAQLGEGANEFADRVTAGALVPLLVLGGPRRDDSDPGSLTVRAYGEVGFAVITNGTLSAPGPTFGLSAGVQLASDQGLFVLAGLVWEKGGLGDEAGDYSATGIEFGLGYRYQWPGTGGAR